jgi:hypothetical protein
MSIALQPKTKVNEIGNEIRELLMASSRYLDRNDFAVRLLLKKCAELTKVDAALGHVTTALAHQLYGDAEGMEYHFLNAKRLKPDQDGQFDHFWAQACANLGRFSKAQALLKQTLLPELGFFTYRALLAPPIGAFHLLLEHFDGALRMNVQLPDDFPIDAVRHATTLLDRDGTSDSDVAAMLDLMGEVLRDRQLFFLGYGPKWDVIEHPDLQMVHFLFQVDATPTEVADMNFDLATRIADRLEHIPEGFHVSFTGRKA